MRNVKSIILEVKDLNTNILGPKYIWDVTLSDFKHTQEIQEAEIILFIDEDGETFPLKNKFGKFSKNNKYITF